MKYVFISFSEEQERFANDIKNALSKYAPWVYTHEVKGGDDIFEKVGMALEQANIFIVILSEESVKSEWVKNELRVAYAKIVSGESSRIIPVLWESKVEIPTFLKGLKYIKAYESTEVALSEIEKAVEEERTVSQKRRFINRHEEIGKLSDWIHDPQVRLISIFGMTGIGKETLIIEAIKRNWQSISVKKLELTSGHIGAGLTVSLCALADLEIPNEDTPEEQLEKLNKIAIEKICISKQLLLITGLESLLGVFKFLCQGYFLAAVSTIERPSEPKFTKA